MLALTPRQRDLCQMLIDGYSQREMSTALGLKGRTIKSEFNRIYRRNFISGGVPRVKLAVLFWREQNGVT